MWCILGLNIRHWLCLPPVQNKTRREGGREGGRKGGREEEREGEGEGGREGGRGGGGREKKT